MVAATAAIASAVASAAPTVAALGTAYAGIKQTEIAGKAASAEKEAIEDQQESDRQAIAAEQAKTLEKRKSLVNKQRKQLPGAGDYSISQTGATGTTASPLGVALG